MSQIKVFVEQEDFFQLISKAYSLIEKRNVMPILSKILISAKEGRLSLQATDQNNSLQGQISAKVETPGDTVVDAQSLYDILKELSEGEVQLKGQSNQKVKIEQGVSVFHLLSVDVQDFPAFPPFEMKDSFRIKPSDLKNLIEKTAYCSSVDETSYHLTGVFFEGTKKITGENKTKGELCFRFVATDGHRLGLAEVSCEKPPLEKGVIISKKGVQEIKKLISYPSSDKEVEVALDSPRILFKYGGAVLSVKLVEGGYPNYQPFIPKSSSISVELNTESFQQTLRRVSLLSNNRFKGVNFNIKAKKIQMEAENPDLGSAQDEVSCIRKKGQDLKVRFNARYVLEALSTVPTEKALVEFGGREKPCVIRPLSKKEQDQNSIAVVMPMKI